MTTPSLFVISPHLDDAAFGCGALLAAHPGSEVCTIFCALPRQPLSTEWDASAGFTNSTDAMHARFIEDDSALAILQAAPLRLPFLDHQYGDSPAVDEIADALVRELSVRRDRQFVMPLGLVHPDHQRTGDACLAAFRELSIDRCIVYEEALYRAIPGTVEARIDELRGRYPKLSATRHEPDYSTQIEARSRSEIKHAATRAYVSQFPALAHMALDDLNEPERFWEFRFS